MTKKSKAKKILKFVLKKSILPLSNMILGWDFEKEWTLIRNMLAGQTFCYCSHTVTKVLADFAKALKLRQHVVK